MFIKPDALLAAASKVNREWGYTGYGITAVVDAGDGACMLTVVASDGSEFFVGSTRYGNTAHAESPEECQVELDEHLARERQP